MDIRKRRMLIIALILTLGLVAFTLLPQANHTTANTASTPMAISAGWCGRGCADGAVRPPLLVLDELSLDLPTRAIENGAP